MAATKCKCVMEKDASALSIGNGCSVHVCVKSSQSGRSTCRFKLKTWHSSFDDLVWVQGCVWSCECSL